MQRTPLIVIGVVLVVLGAATLIWKSITYRQRDTVVDVGPVNVTTETEKSIPLPPILGGLLLAGGIVLIVVGARK